MKIHNFNDFTTALLDCGFSMGGENSDTIFALASLTCDTEVKWHTGEPDTDPWEWRIRVLTERDDIAYSKFFFKKSGYIAKEFYPYFLAIRRGGLDFEDKYFEGKISRYAKKIYDVVASNKSIPLHELKKLTEFSGEDKSKFDRALIELQMGFFITMCGSQQKCNKMGEPYGWSSTVFCTTEAFFGEEIFIKASKITEQEAIEKITNQVYKLNPNANKKKILKFIRG